MCENQLVADKLRRWEKYLRAFRLPLWDEIPDLGLYMDQIIVLLTQYLDYLPPEIKDGKCITAAAINNYVRIKAMPEPVKKKYYRIHIAYLIMICTLKQTLSISTLQKFIPLGLPEEQVKEFYNSYAERHRSMAEHFINLVKETAAPILNNETGIDSAQQTNNLIAASAIGAGFAQLLAEKLLYLIHPNTEEESEKSNSKSNKKEHN